jgi:uncharacterized protein (DUF433 family)
MGPDRMATSRGRVRIFPPFCANIEARRQRVASEYVEKAGGAYRVAGSRVSLDSVVYAFLRGESPEGIAESFPALNLEQVYGAIAYYLGHRDTIDAYLRAGKAGFVRLREQARRDHPSLYAKIEAIRAIG